MPRMKLTNVCPAKTSSICLELHGSAHGYNGRRERSICQVPTGVHRGLYMILAENKFRDELNNVNG